MESERELARVHGLGRGSLLGFTLILTGQEMVGIDNRRGTFRLWVSIMLGATLGVGLILLILDSGLEPVLFRVHPLLSFITILVLVISIPISMSYLVPVILMKRIRRASYSTIHAPKKDIILIETRQPGRTTQRGYFTVRLLNGTSFTFWTIGPDMFQKVNSLLMNFAPGQTRDLSGMTPESIDVDVDRPNNRLLTIITGAVILLALVGGITLTPAVAFGILIIHGLLLLAYLALRRARRRL